MSEETLKVRTARLEQLLGEWPSKEGTVASWADQIRNEIEVQRRLVEQHDDFVEEKVKGLKTDVHVHTLIGDFQVKCSHWWKTLAILKKVVSYGALPVLHASPKVRVSKVKGFSGNRNAKELENFLWDME